MKADVKVKKIPQSQMELTITIDDGEMKKYKEKAMKQLGENVKVKGFRPGHVPKDILEKEISEEGVLGLAIDMAMNDAYRDAVIDEKIKVISRPEIKLESEAPLKFTATVAVQPEVKVRDHKKITVKIKEPKIDKKEIQATIDDLLKGKGAWADVDRAAKDGDRAEIDFQGYDGTKAEEGKELENTNSKNHPLILGSNSFVPGFEEEVIGMKVGETKEFTLSFPKDYHVKDFQNKKVTFKAELKRLEEQTLPEYNDEFIKEATNGAKANKKEFEAYVEEVLGQKKKEDARGEAENELIDKIIKATDLDIAPQLINQEVEVIFNDFKKQIESRGITVEKHLELTKQKPEDMKKEMEKEAKKRITMRFALDYIIDQEKIEVSEADMQKEVDAIKARYPEGEKSKIDEYYAEEGEGRIRLKNMMVVGKVFGMYLK